MTLEQTRLRGVCTGASQLCEQHSEQVQFPRRGVSPERPGNGRVGGSGGYRGLVRTVSFGLSRWVLADDDKGLRDVSPRKHRSQCRVVRKAFWGQCVG